MQSWPFDSFIFAKMNHEKLKKTDGHEPCLISHVWHIRSNTGLSLPSAPACSRVLPDTSKSLTPSLSSISCPHPLHSPHLIAYPGRTLGDAATGGCGHGLPVHCTAWSVGPLPPSLPHQLSWVSVFKHVSLWLTPYIQSGWTKWSRAISSLYESKWMSWVFIQNFL